MIEFIELSQDTPYILFKEQYDIALSAGQKNIEAISISSFNKEKNEVDSRFVNLKCIKRDSFIFFSNYNSPKAAAFDTHDQISALFYWSSINLQIRLKAKINKTSINFNNEYFKNRSYKKNALAISSDQSRVISSYKDVIEKYEEAKINEDLSKCPTYWGGFKFTPFYFEFWNGHDSRLNRREVFEHDDGTWKNYYLEP